MKMSRSEVLIWLLIFEITIALHRADVLDILLVDWLLTGEFSYVLAGEFSYPTYYLTLLDSSCLFPDRDITKNKFSISF